MKMKQIDKSTIRLVDSFGYNKSGSIFYKNLATVKNGDDLNCFIVLKGKYKDGKLFKKEYKVSFKSYKELFDLTLENIKREYNAKPFFRS